jgi:hypothetical protein
MIAYDPGWFDGQIHALSRTKAVLELLIRKTDAELISLKIQRNARSPLCRLPNELLIRIFALAQLRDKIRGPLLPLERCMPAMGWWRVEGVCSRFRAVIVDAPELWTRFNAYWPEEARRLCLLRANGRPLRVLRPVKDTTTANDASLLLQTSQQAALVFTSSRGVAAWPDAYLSTLRAHTSSLQLLGIRTGSRCNFPVLHLTPPLLAHFTHLSHLQIKTRILIDNAFSFPPSLKSLSIDEVIISVQLDRVRRLFQGLPSLEHFKALRCEYHDQLPVLQRHDSAPVTMPCLESLVLHLCGATFVRAVSQSITSPQRILEISALNFPGVNSDGLFHDKDAGLGLVADIRAYAQRFWKQVTGSAHSPPVIVKDRFSPPYTYCAVTMDIGQEQNSVGPSLLLEVAAYPLTPDDPFLPLVTKLVLSVDTENPVLALDEDKWPVVGRLSALHTLIIEAESPWELMHEVEAWATRRKQQRAVLVEFTPTFNEELDPAQEHLDRPKLQWTASDGPIQNAEWGAYMEEVELYKLRQEAEEIRIRGRIEAGLADRN